MALENTDLFLIQEKDTKAKYQVSYETLTDDLVIDLNLADLGQWVPTNGTLFPKDAANNVAIGNTVGDPRITFTASDGSITAAGKVTLTNGKDLTLQTDSQAGYIDTENRLIVRTNGTTRHSIFMEDGDLLIGGSGLNQGTPSGNIELKGSDGSITAAGTVSCDEVRTNDVYVNYPNFLSGNGGFVSLNENGNINVYPTAAEVTAGSSKIQILPAAGGSPYLSLNANGSITAAGNITAASFTGPVTGDITGDITGNINGNVVGDVTGDLTGDVNGNVNGNLTGDVTGDVTGNLTGNVDGNVTGDLTGDVTGNVNGNVTGDVTGDLTGNADTATKLKTARTISLSGDVSGSANFDGSSNITISSTVADDSHNHVISNVDGLQSALDGKLNRTGDTASGQISFNGGAGAAIIKANSDIRFENGNWTGDACKIQQHTNILYLQGGTGGINFRSADGNARAFIDSSGHFLPGNDNTYDMGKSGTKWGRIYARNYSLESLPDLP